MPGRTEEADGGPRGPSAAYGAAAEPDMPARETVLGALDGDVDLLRQLVGLWDEESGKMLRAIEEAVEAGETGRLESAAHRLKGAAQVFRAAPVVEPAAALEAAARSGGTPDPALVDRLRRAVPGLARHLEEILGPPEGRSGTGPAT